ncbi:MAG: iron-containing redox enzyme family protein [Actinobacteria bacterium]|nr:iron-containing redox enzyme family protein [Actinomycetota bacterium]
MPELRALVEAVFIEQVEEFTACAAFRRLECGGASTEDYHRFLANLVRTHSRSPQLIAFLYSLAPPDAAEEILHNLLEELGIEEESGESHPAMLEDLAAAAGLSPVLAVLERLAANDLRDIVSAPLMYRTLKEVGLAAMCEIVAFEFMLSRCASRIERALEAHLGLPPEALRWFRHHAEVDIAHAEQGLEHIDTYVRYYGLTHDDARGIVGLTLRENVFVTRYFDQASPVTPRSPDR